MRCIVRRSSAVTSKAAISSRYSKFLVTTSVSVCLALSNVGSVGASPQVTSTWDLPGRPKPVRIEFADGRIYGVANPSKSDVFALDVIGGQSSQDVHIVDFEGRPFDLALRRTQTLDAASDLPVIREILYIASSANHAELQIARVTPNAPPVREAAIDLPGTANALAVAVSNDLVFVGRASSKNQELVVLDADGIELGGLDLPKRIDSIEVDGDMVIASNKRVAFEIDVTNPAEPMLVTMRPTPDAEQPPLEVRRTTDFVQEGPMAYLAVKDRDAEVQGINLRIPLNFADYDGDGFLTLGCAGDSNTMPVVALTKWCERLLELVDDPAFRVVNVGVAGATAIPSTNDGYAQVEALLDPSLRVDAIVLSFGTNDTNLVHFDPNPALFESQLDEIAMSLFVLHSEIQATGRRAYVVTAPPRWRMLFGPDGFNERITGLNSRIAQVIPEGDIVDSYGFFYADTTEVGDGVHLNAAGHNKRAWRMLTALTR